jgi:hypothetical protein
VALPGPATLGVVELPQDVASHGLRRGVRVSRPERCKDLLVAAVEEAHPLVASQGVQLALGRPDQEGQSRDAPGAGQIGIRSRLDEQRVPLDVELGRFDCVASLSGLAPAQ